MPDPSGPEVTRWEVQTGLDADQRELQEERSARLAELVEPFILLAVVAVGFLVVLGALVLMARNGLDAGTMPNPFD